MNSEELNQRIKEICNSNTEFDAFGGKPIPFVGWFWREVNFDSETYQFGIIPSDKDYDHDLVGFMENNKWDYSYVRANKDEWKYIKKLLTCAVEKPTNEKLESVNNAIQDLSCRQFADQEVAREDDSFTGTSQN